MTTGTNLWSPLLASAVILSPGLVSVSSAHAQPRFCQPLTTSARILKSPAPNDTDPSWLGSSYVGLSWNLVPLKRITNNDTVYIKGKLLPPFSPGRGDVYEQYVKAPGEKVWVVEREWTCE
jgi:hypothetical protein